MRNTVSFFFSLLLLYAASYQSFAQGAPQTGEALAQTSAELLQTSRELKTEWQEHERQLNDYKKDLTLSRSEVEALEEKSTALSTSVNNWMDSSEHLSQKLAVTETKLKTSTVVNIVLGVLLVLAWVYKVVSALLRLKGVHTPWILDWLL